MEYDLSKEEDVKEFLEKLGIEYRFGCFSEKKPESCHLLGDYLESVKKDYEKAGKIYRNNCDEFKYSKSCAKYGSFCYLGKGVKQSTPEALSYYEKGCKAGDSKACTSGGLMLFTDKTNPKIVIEEKQIEKGRDLLDSGCAKNDDYACYYLSGLYIRGKGEAIPKDMNAAFRYTQKSCELGNLFGCVNLSQMYRRGDGVEKDKTQADFYKAKAIDMQKEYKESISMQRTGS